MLPAHAARMVAPDLALRFGGRYLVPMSPQAGVLRAIQQAVRTTGCRITLHATAEAVADDIDPRRLPGALLDSHCELIESYPEDPRGASALVLTQLDGEPLHIVCSHAPRVVIITVYRPDPGRWRESRVRL